MALLKQRELILVIGPCGAGKTTYARAHYPQHAQPDFEALLRACRADGTLCYYPELRATADRLMDLAVRELLKRGIAVCITDSGATRKERRRWITIADGAPVRCIRLIVTPAIAIARGQCDPMRPTTSRAKWPAIVQHWYQRWEAPDPQREGFASYQEVIA